MRERAIEIAPQKTEKQPMGFDQWSKIYAMRDGQLILLYSLDDTGLEKLKSLPHPGISRAVDKNMKFRIGTYDETSRTIESWGDFVQYAAISGLDLTGLTLSPEQKTYLYESELQKKNLKGATLNHAVLDSMNLSGTDLSEARLRHASLKNCTGQTPNFSKARAYMLDLSGSNFTHPNFENMSSPGSIHFRCTYELPTFKGTDWSSAHIIGTRFFLNNNNDASLELTSALVGACLFYGLDPAIKTAGLKFAYADFPGSCFYNLSLDIPETARKADFSPLLLQDPRLTEEEAKFASTFGQWINSSMAMDGVKVSPEVELLPEPKRILTMFSEMKFGEPRWNNPQPLFFSKGPVLHRASFNECRMLPLEDILPGKLADALKATNAPVLAPAEEKKEPSSPPPPAGSLKIPAITFDKDQITLQIEALKKASITDAVAVGSNLQTSLIEATKIVSDWGMTNLEKRPLKNTLDDLTVKIQACSLKKPGAVEALEEFPRPHKKENFFKWLFLTDVDELLNGKGRTVTPPPPVRNYFNEAAQALGAFPNGLNQAIQENSIHLSDAERLQKFLQTLQDAFGAYIEEMTAETEEIKKVNEPIMFALTVRKGNLEASKDVIARLNGSVKNLVAAMAKDGLAYQWLQSMTIPALNTQFSKASGLHDLTRALEQGASVSGGLAGLYSAVVKPSDPTPPLEQIEKLFGESQRDILEKLQDVQKSLEQSHQQRTDILKNVLSLS